MRADTAKDYHERMLRVLVHIQEHLDEALDLASMAAIAHFSPYHFHRIFQGMVGESVMAHIRRLRLERAAQQLKHSDRPVTRIAFEAGYETHEAFTRAFRASIGESPSRFRQIHQAISLPAAPSGVHYAAGGGPEDFTPVQTGGSRMDVQIREVPKMRVAFVRHVGPYIEVHAAWAKLCGWAGPHGLFGPQAKMLGVCHDDPEVTPPDKIRYDACITVGEEVQPEDDIGVQEVGGGEYATTLHHGPYERLAQTYAELCGQWLPSTGREVRSGPSIEMYQNSPQDTAPEDLRTEVYVPLDPQ